MATLADLVKKQKDSGASRTGALFTAVGQKTLAAIDPRKMFNQKGLLTALFPSLKAYKPESSRSKVDTASAELSGSTTPLLEQMVVKLDSVDITMRLVAKNTMAMPGMSRDMNIMRQNVVKLVKLQGGKASTRADSFFLRAFERERATEAQLQAAKERRATGKATALTATKEGLSSIPGLGMLTGLATAIYAVGKNLVGGISSLAEMLGPLLKGGLSLLLDFGKGAANLAIKGGSTLFDLAKKIPFTKIIRGLLSFISGAGGMALLGVGGAAAALNYLLTHEKTEYGDTSQHTPGQMPSMEVPGQFADPGALGASELDAARPSTQEERVRARENMRNSSDPDVRRAAAELDRSDPLSTSPTPVSLSGFEKMAVDMIKKHEGLPKNGKAYKDAHGHSIGYGHFITPAEKERGYIIAGDEQIPIDQNNILNTSITKEQAEKLLAQDLPKYIQAAKSPLGEAWDRLNDSQKAALVSSAYNTGQGGIQHLIKKGLKDAIMRGDFKKAGEIIKEHGYKTAVIDGQRQTVTGLVNRRAEEGAILAGQTSGRSDQLMAASSAVSDSKQEMTAQPIIVDASTKNNVQNNNNVQGGNVADTFNNQFSELLKLSMSQV
jgi:GH24 family phage-related lysozyme (muramidase)